jgi:protein-L-isoaspartate(D-aspartate) O-methyltransferase
MQERVDTAMNSLTLRDRMIQYHLAARGIRDPRVLRAMRAVDRAQFVPPDLVEFAYDDTPLPIDEDQTISQPYVVALMIEALELKAGDRVLEVGAGSGYACAVAGRIAASVFGIERHASLARAASDRCRRLGHTNVHIRHGDGTLGWPEHAPYDAIMVAAGGPGVPPALESQLSVGGRLVIPVGQTPREQSLLRIRRTGPTRFEREDLGPVRFVPLIGVGGWKDQATDPAAGARDFSTLVAREGEPFATVDEASLEGLLDRICDARVVCLGEASHGTAEFYTMRAAITRALIERKGFTVVALEADWPEAQRLDRHVRQTAVEPHPEQAFDRFPTWMWANRQMTDFVDWLAVHNRDLPEPQRKVGVYGLDLYSLHRSAGAVLRYLEDVDPESARIARHRYGCLDPWQADPAAYGAAVLAGAYKACEQDVVSILTDLLHQRLEPARDPERLFDAERNAQLVANAERYYRTMYYGTVGAWNLRDQHMFDTLDAVLRHRGPEARAVVWAHNSHLGDAAWTEMGARGEHNIGRLCRARYGEDVYLVGFGTDHGTVAAAAEWDGPMQVMEVRPAHQRSYEALCHSSRLPGFLLPLRTASRTLRRRLSEERLERAIGVVYRPATELESHYFTANLARQFDEWIWLDETRAVDPLDVAALEGLPQTYPFGT